MSPETSPVSSADDSDAAGWGIWLQWLLVTVVFVGAAICLRNCAEIATFELKYRELGGKPLPPLTEWLLQYRTIFISAAVFTPLAALGTFVLRERSQACSVLLALMLFSGFEAFVIYEGLRLPFMVFMKSMGRSAGGEG